MPNLTLDNGTLFYEEAGQGPPMLLLHAGVCDSRMWRPQVAALAPDHRVVSCDLRGFGASPLPDGPFSYADDVAVLVQALELAPAWCVAASFGGLVALDVALAYPHLLQGLVLFAPAVSGWPPGDDVAEFGRQEEALLDAGALQAAADLNAQTWAVGPQRAPESVDAVLQAAVAEMQLATFLQPQPAGVSLRELDPPAWERLETIALPCLVVSGALDMPSFVALGEQVAARIPGAQRVVVPDAAHLPSMELPALCTSLIQAFMAGQSS
ncbi:MAG TPA: alpha/beta fold hydrolase [Roseiflexaceae bacterium]|nr:alpha/beta fold hydrolase [Roseiflexaceae bacterium]